MANRQRVCIVGGGIAGVGLLWTLAQDEEARDSWEITLIHDDDALGGHARTRQVQHNGSTIPVDTGVQFYIPFLYPNTELLLSRPEFKGAVPVANYDELKIACAFPPAADGSPRNWGNFPEYQKGKNYELYSTSMYLDSLHFQSSIDLAAFKSEWRNKTVADYFEDPPLPYLDKDAFQAFIVDPYLSIINGYGKTEANQVTFMDLLPLFGKIPGLHEPLGSFTRPGQGYRRFLKGASSLVEQLATVAETLTDPHVLLNSKVEAIWADPSKLGEVHVQWTERCSDGTPTTKVDKFDKVVITTDMHAARKLLKNDKNDYYWSQLYSHYLDKKSWTLLPGQCFIHTDEGVLSPDMREQKETLQFTAYYSAQDKAPGYDLFTTYTTYLQENIHDDPAAKGLYLTMYGYIPDKEKYPGMKTPDPDSLLFEEKWTHGMWLPNFMMDAKRKLHMAQGLGSKEYPGQMDTNIYFAGNNTTADSLEHAFISGMVMADYAFGVGYPLGFHPYGWGMYELFYHEFMFPSDNPSEKIANLHLGAASRI